MGGWQTEGKTSRRKEKLGEGGRETVRRTRERRKQQMWRAIEREKKKEEIE